MILELIPQRETAPLLGSAALKKGTPPYRDALPQLYTTFAGNGTRGGRPSLADGEQRLRKSGSGRVKRGACNKGHRLAGNEPGCGDSGQERLHRAHNRNGTRGFTPQGLGTPQDLGRRRHRKPPASLSGKDTPAMKGLNMLLLDYARNEVGVACNAFHHRHYGWTTDQDKAERLRTAGAEVVFVRSLDAKPEGRKFDGFEVSFQRGQEVERERV